jgi:hypothetical protein
MPRSGEVLSNVRKLPIYVMNASLHHWHHELFRKITSSTVSRHEWYAALLSEGPVCLERLRVLTRVRRFDAALELSNWVKVFLDDVGEQGQEFRESLDPGTRGELDVARCRILWEMGLHADLAKEVIANFVRLDVSTV